MSALTRGKLQQKFRAERLQLPTAKPRLRPPTPVPRSFAF